MKRATKITRQISALVLMVVFAASLLLATGLLTFSGRTDPGANVEILDGPSAPPLSDGSETDGNPNAQPESALAVLAAILFVTFTVVLLWFLVFRPISEQPAVGQPEHANAKTNLS